MKFARNCSSEIGVYHLKIFYAPPCRARDSLVPVPTPRLSGGGAREPGYEAKLEIAPRVLRPEATAAFSICMRNVPTTLQTCRHHLREVIHISKRISCIL